MQRKIILSLAIALIIISITNIVKAEEIELWNREIYKTREITTLASVTNEETVEGITWVYTLENEQATNVKPKDKTSLPNEVTIPSTLNGYKVTSIGNQAFYDCSSLTSISIPEGVTSIGDWAFRYCRNLTNITISEGVTSIGNFAFGSCSILTSITIPEGVTSIGNGAFENCSNLTSINIPAGVTSIAGWAFSNCRNITSISIPAGVTSIAGWAFSNCSSLTSISIPEGVTSIGDYAFYGCSSIKSISIPEGVTSIGGWAFSNCRNITSISIPAGVTSIGAWAFSNCGSLTSISIPKGVTNIGESAFKYCSNLTSISIPSSVTSIGEQALSICSNLIEINVDIENKNYLSEEGVLFNKEKTELIQYPVNNERTSYIIPEGVTSIGENAFYNCSNLTSISIPEGVTSIGDETFAHCSKLTSIGIPEGVTSIGDSAFSNCERLTSISIPEGVTSIGDRAFSSCGSLTSISIPEGVTSIGDNAFRYCRNITIYTNNDYVVTYAQENNINYIVDKEAPTIKGIEGNPEEWTKENVTLVVNAEDTESGLATEAYSFDGGNTWQAENTKTYTDNINGIIIKVKDNLGNTSTYEEINITKIDRDEPTIKGVEGNPEEWTKENVTLVVNAEDTESGLATEAYSFDGGNTWQAENTKTYTDNINGIIIKVKDNLGNIATYEEINITKILKLENIAITTAPTKTSYTEGENFDPTGMEVTATYNNGSTAPVTNYTIEGGDNLTVGQTSVTISYTEDGITKEATQIITVKEKINEEDFMKEDSEYKVEAEENELYITEIVSETKIKEFKEKIKEEYEIELYDLEGNIVTNEEENIKTNMKMIAKKDGETVGEYLLVVIGDCNGTGTTNVADITTLMMSVAENLAENKDESKILKGAYKKAADLNKTSEINSADITSLLMFIAENK